ncbi:hypothetical protein [Listeria innocua]|uniref:hypothetical protein n=1 Tax=Listeria innocua TaxID=1642 RepID=UPI0016276FF6|nr:hypothetical protein [Listeria innocua]MBC1925524.1 hypothetical protein [Listeria innocua]
MEKRNKTIIIFLGILGMAIIMGLIHQRIKAEEKLREIKLEKAIPKSNKIPKKSEDMKTFKVK